MELNEPEIEILFREFIYVKILQTLNSQLLSFAG